MPDNPKEREIAQMRGFARKLITESGIIADTFDGTVGNANYRERIATCFYGVSLFLALTGRRPSEYLEMTE